jgi:hypothetical protein
MPRRSQASSAIGGPGQSFQHDRIRLDSAVVEHDRSIAMGERCPNPDATVVLFGLRVGALRAGLHDLNAIGMDHDTLDHSPPGSEP